MPIEAVPLCAPGGHQVNPELGVRRPRRTPRVASPRPGIDHLARLLFAALQFLRGAKARILPPGTYDHSLLGAHHLDCDEGDLYDPATDLIKFIVSTACSNS